VRVGVYVDGFNLYHRALKKSQAPGGGTYKWLDLQRLATLMLNDPRAQIVSIRYFTARVLKLPRDQDAPARQGQYLRALRTLPNLNIHYGLFKRREDWMQLVNTVPSLQPITNTFRIYASGDQCAFVHKFSEKGSDVNLASYLLLDAFQGVYETAAVITNDSDLVEPIRIVRDVLKKPILVFDPSERRSSAELKNVATFYKPIRGGVIAASQFPNPLTDARGQFTKPPSW
jgi:hypothetical protein